MRIEPVHILTCIQGFMEAHWKKNFEDSEQFEAVCAFLVTLETDEHEAPCWATRALLEKLACRYWATEKYTCDLNTHAHEPTYDVHTFAQAKCLKT